MKQMRDSRVSGLVGRATVVRLAGVVLAAGWGAGCRRPAEPTEGAVPPPVAEVSTAAAGPAPVVPEDAPRMQTAHPLLATGMLTYARLAELPPGVLLQAEGVRVTATDLEADLQQAPSNMRAQLAKNRLLLLEQRATEALLRRAAQAALPGTAGDDALPRFIQQLTAQADVSEAEVQTFYDENQDMMGGAPLAQIAPRIRQHLLQQQQQQAVMEYIQNLGQSQVIVLAADWVAEQAAAALDNPVDRARASGVPTLVSFGADTCIPCQTMKPVREAVQAKYGERLNVVYVHVNLDPVLAQRYGVQGIPFMIFFDADGAQVHEQSGIMTEEQIEAWLARAGVEDAG